MICFCELDTPAGKMVLAATESALVGAWFLGQKHFGSGQNMVPGNNRILQRAGQWLQRYFHGENPDPAEVPLKPTGTPFQEAVWECLCRIPYGQTAAYGDISVMLRKRGMAACAQAVGGAVGRNPISIFIPCHRVVGAGGKMTGYAGGVEKKAFLLKLEQTA